MEKQEKSVLGKIIYFIFTLVLIYIIVNLYNLYSVVNFNEFVKTEYNQYASQFLRDKETKYSDIPSYKIESIAENDAMFYKKIKVEPNTPYRVKCMVKTKDVKTIKENSSAGANICIIDTVEKSKSITGTNDWQELEFIFNSKNREEVNIGFRLGGYDDNCTGTVWFSEMSIEAGTSNTNTDWNFVCFIFENTDVTINSNRIKLSMNSTDISDINQNMSRFKTSCESLSGNHMSVSYDIINITDPITSLTYDDINGYYVMPQDIENIIEPYLENKTYDHIFVAVRLGDNIHQNDIQVNDWIGLGGMQYLGTGFSNIRLPNSDKSYIYKYDYRINTFPEEVFIHEFLHSLERTSEEYGYSTVALHDYEKYGYKDEKLTGLKNWYRDYMQKKIKNSDNTYVGLPKEIYSLKPNNKNNFEFSYKLNEFKEPKNIIEEIKLIFNKVIYSVIERT